MRSRGLGLCIGVSLALLVPPQATSAYPGGTPTFQTDAAPFCAGCHASRTVEMLAGAPGGRASRSRRTRVSSVLTSRVGAGSEKARSSCPDGSSVSDSSRRVQARPWPGLQIPLPAAYGEIWACMLR